MQRRRLPGRLLVHAERVRDLGPERERDLDRVRGLHRQQSVAASAELQGSWLATTDGKAVALVVTGEQAALFTTGGSICSGTAGEEAGMQMIHLKCTDKSTTRATGMVGSVSKSGLSVTWSGSLGKETYTKAEGGKLPSGLATAGLGS